MVLIMVWLFILLTVVTYGFVMKYVLSHIQKTAREVRTAKLLENGQMAELATVHSVR